MPASRLPVTHRATDYPLTCPGPRRKAGRGDAPTGDRRLTLEKTITITRPCPLRCAQPGKRAPAHPLPRGSKRGAGGRVTDLPALPFGVWICRGTRLTVVLGDHLQNRDQLIFQLYDGGKVTYTVSRPWESGSCSSLATCGTIISHNAGQGRAASCSSTSPKIVRGNS